MMVTTVCNVGKWDGECEDGGKNNGIMWYKCKKLYKRKNGEKGSITYVSTKTNNEVVETRGPGIGKKYMGSTFFANANFAGLTNYIIRHTAQIW